MTKLDKPADGECVSSNDGLYRIFSALLDNAELIPDPKMGGSTNCYRVPIDDIHTARTVLDLLRQLENEVQDLRSACRVYNSRKSAAIAVLIGEV